MTSVAKYNTFKGISTSLTFGTPLVTLFCVGEFFVDKPSTAISGAAIFTLLLIALFAKDKLAEKFKTPSALILALAALLFCVVIENIIFPVKIISIATAVACGVDELSFKRMYKGIEVAFIDKAAQFKKFGFFAVKQTALDGLK